LSSFKLFWETNFLPVQTDISTLVTKKLLRLDCEELVVVTLRLSVSVKNYVGGYLETI